MPQAPSTGGPSESDRRPAAEDGLFDAFCRAIDRTAPISRHFAIAFSGGSDSLALLHLAVQWSVPKGQQVSALIVDHGLRPDSPRDAESAIDLARNAGAEPVLLTWDADAPESGIQSAARSARYGLMIDWCNANGVRDLMLGHHLDDQAATVAMRLRHGSGISGLAAMRSVTVRDGVRLLRPLLTVRKSELGTWLTERDLPWIEDPTNVKPVYERNRINRWLESLDPDDPLAERLARLAHRSARAEEVILRATDIAWDRFATERPGRVVFRQMAWWAEPAEVRLRLLDRAIQRLTGSSPRLLALEQAVARLSAQRRINLGGAIVSLGASWLTVKREPPRRT